ncbi:hypothetical protein K466DRAFT_557214 [Polyporus arcularius HHB13444]|uniref:BTB domain-containing protein n=1 Tax=Polyporus arcularius HHB13444 TaxID=1314778 RepID=A0A5C3NX06_9APHY|nr:hypothetical protein K466DRAFT_557214 [Polyporus arcularius HHB13444]
MSGQSTRKRSRAETRASVAPYVASSERKVQNTQSQRAKLDAVPTVEYGEGGTKLSRDDEFWYKDGNVVIVAGDTKFRVFKGILEDHSPVLKDMLLRTRREARSSEFASNAPMYSAIHLTDTVEEVRHLLRTCIPKSPACLHLSTDPTYEEVAMSVRLGRKYGIAALVDNTIAYLKRYYPSDFDAWQKLDSSKSPPKFKPEHAIGVVNLALLTGATTLLPSALFVCCMLDNAVLAGAKCGNTLREHLPTQLVQVSYAAQRRLAGVSISIVLRVCTPATSAACTQAGVCLIALWTLFTTEMARIECYSHYNPLQSYEGLFRHLHGRLCAPCYAMLCERDVSQRRTLWKSLPQILGIIVDGWADNTSASLPPIAT